QRRRVPRRPARRTAVLAGSVGSPPRARRRVLPRRADPLRPVHPPVPLAPMSSRTLSETASKQLLVAYGLPVPDEREVATADAAVDAASAVGLPVVVKLCGDAIAHKTERGLVRLRL